jgi:transcriptional regulator with GAF, ATPase, and Fis domain
MVVPLFAGPQDIGLVTVDKRECGRYSQTVLETAGVYGQLISLTIHLADVTELLRRHGHQLDAHNRLLIEEAGASQAIDWLEAARNPAMRELVTHARQVSGSNLPVLILGETGVGKEVLAQAIHAWSPRSARPFVKLNCSAIPENLAESELFGHTKGAFSGADKARQGRFVTANGGTLLLDEIGDMPLAAQAKLLRVLQEGTFEPVGSDHTVRVDVRVLAATHKNLEDLVQKGQFRQDLFYRLAVFPLRVPSLRERREDAVIIADTFLACAHRQTRRGPWTLSRAARAAIESAGWPGNVRELHNVLERATLLNPNGLLEPQHLRLSDTVPASPKPAAESAHPPQTFEAHERAYLEGLLASCAGQIYGPSGAAKLAGLKPTTLRSKLIKHGLR